MISADEFGEQLMQLDPGAFDFPRKVDALVAAADQQRLQDLLPHIFRFFEANPLDDCGPGTLVHLAEHFYPSYKPLLLSSLRQRPSLDAMLMVNRMLNSDLPTGEERREYHGLLQAIAGDSRLAAGLREEARQFLEYQASKGR